MRCAASKAPDNPQWGLGGQGAQRRSKGPRKRSGTRERKTRRPSAATGSGSPEFVSAKPTTKLDFKERSGLKTTLGATDPYALFLPPSHPELQRRIEVISAGVSAEMDDSAHLSTTPLTQSTALGVVNSGIHFRWKGGVWLSTAFEVPWHRVDSHRAQRRRTRFTL